MTTKEEIQELQEKIRAHNERKFTEMMATIRPHWEAKYPDIKLEEAPWRWTAHQDGISVFPNRSEYMETEWIRGTYVYTGQTSYGLHMQWYAEDERWTRLNIKPMEIENEHELIVILPWLSWSVIVMYFDPKYGFQMYKRFRRFKDVKTAKSGKHYIILNRRRVYIDESLVNF